ncbi:MAG: hypothetical protein U0Q03_05900 [Acidimicrobiales bacterium]
MSDLADDELERRLRSTYARVTATTRLTGRPLDVPERRPLWPVRVSIAMAAVVVLVLLGVVVSRQGDEASGRGDGPRWALVSLYRWGFEGVRPYDPTTDGLGDQRGDVITYRRDGATVQVMSLRDATIDETGLAANPDGQSPVVSVSPDERLVVRHLGGDLTLVLRYEGDTDVDHVPDMTMLARTAVTVGQDAWARAQQRQGFATLGLDGPEPVIEYRFDDGMTITREVQGTLRGGFNAVYRSDFSGFGGVPTSSDPAHVVVYALAEGEPYVVRANPGVASVEIDGVEVPLHRIVDPDSGVAVGWAQVELGTGEHRVIGRDASGDVVATTTSAAGSPVVEEAP